MTTTEMLETVEETSPVDNTENIQNTEILFNKEASRLERTEATEAKENALLVTDFTLILHTTPGQIICEGNWMPGKIGLRQFATCVNQLWQAFEQGDPYAQWQLLKIHTAIQTLKTQMQEQESHLRKQLQSLRGMRVKPFRNPKPFIMNFSTANPLILMGASLICQIDMLTCQILTLKQIGIVPQGLIHTQTYREKIQTIFMLGEAWEESGITREAILSNTKKAQQLQKKYGQLPEEILHQTVHLSFFSFLE